jgi:hypothetical protein
MCRKLIYLVSFVLVLGVALTTQAGMPVDLNTGLVAWWTFNEGTGTIAYDGSGNGNHATFMPAGAPLTWVQPGAPRKGPNNYALQLNGTSQFLRIAHSPSLNVTGSVTFEMWVYYTGTPADAFIVKGVQGDGNAWKNLGIRLDDDPVTYRQLNWRSRGGDTVNALNSSTGIPLATWTHVAVTFDVNTPGNNQKIYINGRLNAQNRSANPLTTNTGPLFIGADTYSGDTGRWFYQGMIDEGSLYNRALNALEIKIIAGIQSATDPTPTDGATISTTNALLEWWQGSDVASVNGHHLYFSDKFADVNTGAAGADKGLTTDPNYYVSALVPGTTYYWRVDEVNNADPNLWRGDVWSFRVADSKASVPDPPDDALYVGRNRMLSWAPGTGAISHHIYFGKDQTKVISGHPDVDKGVRTEPNYVPGVLTYDSTYYWRIDEFDGTSTHTGDMWSFQTTASADPNLVGWWTFDGHYLDVTGNENHGRPINDANIVVANDRPYASQTSVLNLNGADECVYVPFKPTLDINTAGTVSVWAYGGAGNDAPIRHGGWNASYSFSLDTTAGFERRIRFRTNGGAAPGLGSTTAVPTNQWTHIALTFDYRVPSPENNQKIYINGVLNAQNRAASAIGRNLYYVALGGREAAGSMWGGRIDDIRIYNRALTASEVQIVMTGDPNLARDPKPADRSTVDEESATPITWSRGVNAAQHDVYFGTSAGAVQNAMTADPLGVYQGRQSATSYTPPGELVWGQTYYWRIDEVNDLHSKSPWKGMVWSFMLTDYLIVDDFEDYNNFYPDRIWENWIDGWGTADPPPGIPGNGTGSTVGYINPPFAETRAAFVHGGSQSIPMDYNNAKAPYYSETEYEWDVAQDWTRKGIKALTLFFKGYPVEFVESSPGRFTIGAGGADIYGTADQFRYVYKQLSGDGTIIAKVLSVSNIDPWVKAGVMIRETLAANSAYAFNLIAPGNGCRYQARLATGVGATSDTPVTQLAHIRPPHWIKIERIGSTFNAYDSNDPATEGWHPLVWNPQTITMQNNVYIGLAVTSHNTSVMCVAEFSDVATTGNVTGQWQSQVIGTALMQGNSTEPLYVMLKDSANNTKVVTHSDPNAVHTTTWQEWNIPLKNFSDGGVILGSIKKMYIGVGNRANPQPVNAGNDPNDNVIYVDDVRLYVPRCIPSLAKPVGDFNNDCVVDYADLDVLAQQWLETVPPALSADLSGDNKIDLNDYALLAGMWLEEELWPQ